MSVKLGYDFLGDSGIGPEKETNLFENEQNAWDLEPQVQSAPKEYNFVLANGQLEISPSFSHDDLASHAGVAPTATGPMAVGNVTLDQGRATWAIRSNMNAQAVAKELKQASKQYGWLWGGMTTIGGEPVGVGSEFAPVKAYVYKLSAFGPGYMADPLMCGNCGSRMGEPSQIGPNKWSQKCTRCGLSRELPQYHPFIKNIQEQTPYPDLLNEVGQNRPWMVTAGNEDHLYLAPTHLAHRIHRPDGVVFVQGKTARVTGLNEQNIAALLEWAEDEGLQLVAAGGAGGNQQDNVLKRIEDLEQFNFSDPNPDEDHQYFPRDKDDKATGQEWQCPYCKDVFETFENYLVHRRDEDSKLDANDFYPEREFPELDMDKPSPFQPKFTPVQPDVNNSYVSHCASYTGDAEKVKGFKTYAKVWGIDSSNHEHFVAYSDGVPVGFASMKGDDWLDMICVSVPGRKIGQRLMRKLQRVYPELYSNGATTMGVNLMRRTGWIQLEDHLWKWAAGEDPKDMIPAAIPFIFDIKHDKLVMGHPGAMPQDMPGGFTPGGIVTGRYEPGGKLVVTSSSNMPWTANHLMRLWYFTNPHMEIKSLHMEQEGGKKTRLAAEQGYMYHVAPRELRDRIRNEGLKAGQPHFDISNGAGEREMFPYSERPVYLSAEPGRSADTRYDMTDKDVWRVNTQGLPLVADLPGLYDNGANFEDDEEGPLGVWYNEGYMPSSLGPYEDEQGMIYHDHLLDPNHPVSQAAIQATQTAAHVGQIPPDRLQLMDSHIAKVAGQDIGGYLQSLVNADSTSRDAYQALTNAGGHVFVVGGAVRDALMDKPPKDVDLMVTGLDPDQIQEALSALPGKTNLTGKDFGVFRYWNKGHDVEIALPRRERSSGGGHKDFVTQSDPNMTPQEDLLRRDFTANAMAVDLNNGDLIDPYGGLKDIKNKTLRTVRPDALAEDPLRVMRALVAASKHGLEPDDQTREAMAKNAPSLNYLPQERLQAELRKIMMGSDPGRAIRLAADTGTLQHILPEVADAVDYNQNNPHHEQDLFNHLVSVMERAKQKKPDDPDFALTGLLHDIGKVPAHWTECRDCGWAGNGNYETCPQCNSENTSGHFYKDNKRGVGQNHEDVGADMVRKRLNYLRYPGDSVNRISDLTAGHMFSPFTSEKGARRFLNTYEPHANDLMDLRWADQGGKAAYPNPTGVGQGLNLDNQRQLLDMVRQKESQGQAATGLNTLAVNGNDLINSGITPGPQLGQALQYLLDQVLDNPELNTKEALIPLAQQYVSQNG